LDESRIDDIPRVSPEENAILTASIRKRGYGRLFSNGEQQGAGPDGFLAELFQTLWEIIKGYLSDLFVELHVGQFELFRINFGEIIVLAKLMT
jgi:hypothetical protein